MKTLVLLVALLLHGDADVMPLQEFPDKQELHRNMLGLLGNVAEVRALRPQLLTPQFIFVFT